MFPTFVLCAILAFPGRSYECMCMETSDVPTPPGFDCQPIRKAQTTLFTIYVVPSAYGVVYEHVVKDLVSNSLR